MHCSLFVNMQMALHLDSNSTIIKAHGKYAGPLTEVEVNQLLMSLWIIIVIHVHVLVMKAMISFLSTCYVVVIIIIM